MWVRHLVTGGVNEGLELFPVDMDLDGDIDILSADESYHGLFWFENTDGHGTFGAARSIPPDLRRAREVLPVDLDRDQDLDLVAILNRYSAEGLVYFERLAAAGSFGPATPVSGHHWCRSGRIRTG